METKGYYSTVGKQGEAEWRKDIVQSAWRLFDAAVELIYHGNVRLGQYIPAKDKLGFAVSALEAKQTDEAIGWFEDAIAASVDAVQVEQIKNLVKRIKGE